MNREAINTPICVICGKLSIDHAKWCNLGTDKVYKKPLEKRIPKMARMALLNQVTNWR